MTRNARIYLLHAISPLHVGTGRGEGYIDLPIMREKVTNWPLVPGSAFKGVLAESFEASEKNRNSGDDKGNLLKAAFGVADSEGSASNSGSLVFTHARILCLPVWSLYGTYVWATSGMALSRMKRDLEMVSEVSLPEVGSSTKEKVLCTANGIEVIGRKARTYLDEYDFAIEESGMCNSWAEVLSKWIFPENESWQKDFSSRFAVLPDDTFNFLCRTGTEVNARIRIDEQEKRVVGRALWYEESLPVETVMTGMVWCDKVFSGNFEKHDLLEHFCSESRILQVGGKATVGKGVVNCLFTGGAHDDQ